MMRKTGLHKLFVLISLTIFLAWPRSTGAQSGTPVLELLDRAGEPITQLTDGDEVRLRLSLPAPAGAAQDAVFRLSGSQAVLGSCRIAAGQDACETAALRALGWYWDDAGNPRPRRDLAGEAGGQASVLAIDVAARPVVMVHGFASDWRAWVNYLGPEGYLAAVGIAGYAVGDGQEPGSLNTGSLTDPAGRTKTIAENAAVLGEYIERVKAATGAQMVDLLAHSMGGLITRYYIDRVMPGRDVAQLIMLGSPMAGTDCANLPAALRLYLPASLEIQPSYVLGIFNPQITHRHGVPFHALAGVPITDPIASPCTATPTDIAVSLESVSAIPLDFTELPILHVDLNLSKEVFDRFVFPLLRTSPGSFADDPDPAVAATSPEPLQFDRIYSGHIDPGGSEDLTIEVEPGLAVANFALYDTSRSLEVTVTGASGSQIQLDPAGNGLTVIDDPSSLLYLGYGFANPLPGPWIVRLSATDRTPPEGADFAIRARYQGGAELSVSADNLLPQVGAGVTLAARLDLAGSALPISEAFAEIIPLEGDPVRLDLPAAAGSAAGTWRPPAAGLYSIAVHVNAVLPDGSTASRVGYLSVEAQPAPTPVLLYTVVLVVLGLACTWVLGGMLLRVLAKRRSLAE